MKPASADSRAHRPARATGRICAGRAKIVRASVLGKVNELTDGAWWLDGHAMVEATDPYWKAWNDSPASGGVVKAQEDPK